MAWFSVPCVTCCPMYNADGDADAPGVIPTGLPGAHAGGPGAADRDRDAPGEGCSSFVVCARVPPTRHRCPRRSVAGVRVYAGQLRQNAHGACAELARSRDGQFETAWREWTV